MKAGRLAITALVCTTIATSAELLTNGDFSSGLNNWTLETAGVGLGGEAQVLPNLGSLAPFSAAQFLLLDTGPSAFLGSATPTYASLSTSFTLASADTITLSFGSAVLTGRFTGALATELDRVTATLTPSGGGSAISIMDVDLANANFQILPNAPVASPSGSTFFEYTPYNLFSQQFALAAGAYTLSFRVETDQNSLFDTGLLLDNVSVQTSNGGPSPVPEPASFALMAGGLVGMGFVRSRSQKDRRSLN